MKRLGLVFIGIGLIAIAAAVWYVTREFSLLKREKEETANVILQQMQSVTQLVTAEGYFSEIYDYKDYLRWDLNPLRKKALMRVKAKVVMGYDLEEMDFTIDSGSKIISITDPTSPQIIALEHDVDYYDLTSGTFNRFSESDLNTLNARAKNFIREVAMQSNLVDLADKRKEEIYNTLRTIAETAGYELRIIRSTPATLQH